MIELICSLSMVWQNLLNSVIYILERNSEEIKLYLGCNKITINLLKKYICS